MKAWIILRKECEKVSRGSLVFEDAEGILWFKERLVVPKRETLKKKVIDEAIHQGTPFILGALRCIMT
jgi:hypothetical protein